MQDFYVFIDEIFSTLSNVINLVLSNWLLSSFLVVIIIGWIIELLLLIKGNDKD